MPPFDRSSKWLIQHHGDSLLRLAGIRNIDSWKAVHSELVQPGQLPDGLIEAQLTGEPGADLYLVEVGTYPEQRLLDQLSRGTALVFLDRRKVPEVLAIILRPKGAFRLPTQLQLESRRGLAAMEIRWTVVELWKLSADELLRFEDPGLVPWITLADDGGQPEPVLRRCREIIEDAAPPEERVNLLAVAQILSRLRYNDPNLFALLGGRSMIIESPFLQEIIAKAQQDSILKVLDARFGMVPEPISAGVRAVESEQALEALTRHAALCETLDEFRSHLD